MKKEEKGEEKMVTLNDLPGVGAATAEKLKECGYSDLMAVAVASPGELVDAAGVGESAARKIINAARNAMKMGFESGDQLLKKRQNVTKITTGCKAFDSLIGGGFETGAISETYGCYGSSKCTHKDTDIIFFNDTLPHIKTMEHAYKYYKQIHGEQSYDNGYIVETPEIKVLGLGSNGLKRTNAKFIYKEFAKKIYELKTRRGRRIRITGPHKLLSFDNGFCWKPAGALRRNDILACPGKLEAYSSSSKAELTEDDGYFLGLFVAEGTSNPLSISTGSEIIKNWLSKYINQKFGYKPTIREDKRRPNVVYTILIRNSTKKLLGKLSLCKAGTKFIPESILSAGSKVKLTFLAGYLDGDGCFSKNQTEMTTKSKRLATELSYLLLCLGISTTIKEHLVDKSIFYRLSVVGEDKSLLNVLPLKVKTSNCHSVNSVYGYPGRIVDYIRDLYKATLGGNRGKKRKPVGRKANSGEIFYSYFTNEKMSSRAMNEKTMLRVIYELGQGASRIEKALVLARGLEKLNKEQFKEMHGLLPFAFNSFKSRLGLSSSTFRNYMQRGLPIRNKSTVARIKKLLVEELESRKQKLEEGLAVLKNISYFKWDPITEIKEVNYNDWVYDFVVPEGHCFVGGNMPTIMHNTQIAHQLAVNIQLPKEKGGAGTDSVAVFIDTENTFRPERIIQLAKGAGINPEKALKNIRVARAFNSDHQMLLAEKIEDLIKNQKLNIKLVIVDSLTAHFRAEFIGRGTLAERQQKLNRHMHVLSRLADTQNICIYVTNQVMAKPDMFFGDPTEAIGGHIVGHNSAFRIYLRKGKKGTRVAKLVDSPNLPEGECAFVVTEAGVKDVK